MLSSEFVAAREIMTEETMEALRARNEQRLQEAKNRLGNRYLLHPENQVKRNSDRNAAHLSFSNCMFQV